MKKIKLLNSIMAASATAAPLCSLTACSHQFDYTKLTEDILENLESNFMDIDGRGVPIYLKQAGLSEIPRATWYCGYIYNYIINKMKIIAPNIQIAGCDEWSQLAEPAAAIQAEIQEKGYPAYEQVDGKYGNIWFDLPATEGCDDYPAIMLQAHMDVTMEWANDQAKNNWKTEGILVEKDTDEDIMYPKGGLDKNPQTSLGADAGAGMALMFAIAQNYKNFKHGKIRLMFTCDESGVTTTFYAGADLLNYDQSGTVCEYADGRSKCPLAAGSDKPFGENYEYHNIISLDAAVQDYIYVSAAGIYECQIHNNQLPGNDINWSKTPTEWLPEFGVQDGKLHQYTLTISGLNGGHSAQDINKGYGNALQWAMKTMTTTDPEFRLISGKSSSSAYKICDSTEITFVSSLKKEAIDEKVNIFKNVYKSAYPKEQFGKITYDITEKVEQKAEEALTTIQSNAIVLFADHLQYGPLTYFDNLDVKTSMNFCPFNLTFRDNFFNLDFHVVVRSASQEELLNLYDQIHLFIHYDLEPYISGTSVTNVTDPVWEPIVDDKLLNLTVTAYNNFQYRPQIANSHGWFECACWLEFWALQPDTPKLNMVCIGPQIYDDHTVNEELYSDSLSAVIKAILYVCMNAKASLQ